MFPTRVDTSAHKDRPGHESRPLPDPSFREVLGPRSLNIARFCIHAAQRFGNVAREPQLGNI